MFREITEQPLEKKISSFSHFFNHSIYLGQYLFSKCVPTACHGRALCLQKKTDFEDEEMMTEYPQ